MLPLRARTARVKAECWVRGKMRRNSTSDWVSRQPVRLSSITFYIYFRACYTFILISVAGCCIIKVYQGGYEKKMATYTKLHDGNWGVRVQGGSAKAGDRVTVSKKSGESKN